MAERLSDFARRYLADPSLKKDLDVPVLLWESPIGGRTPAPGQIQATTRIPALTLPSVHFNRAPSVPEPLVLPLVKGDSPTNAFVMGITVGRTENNDLVLSDPSVSRFHAYFLRDRRTNVWQLVDAESLNGTWVGPMKLQPNAGVELQDQVKLRFGDLEMLFLLPETLFQEMARKAITPAH